jgi:CheY-like chemotaxis protein
VCDNVSRLAVIAKLLAETLPGNRLIMPLHGKRILVVEDEFLLAMHLEQRLTDLGCEVVVNRGGVKGALQRLQKAHFDAAVLDINLGDERADLIADVLASRAIPFIFGTGYDRARLAPRHATRPYLKKPYRDKDLKDAMVKLCSPDTASSGI